MREECNNPVERYQQSRTLQDNSAPLRLSSPSRTPAAVARYDVSRPRRKEPAARRTRKAQTARFNFLLGSEFPRYACRNVSLPTTGPQARNSAECRSRRSGKYIRVRRTQGRPVIITILTNRRERKRKASPERRYDVLAELETLVEDRSRHTNQTYSDLLVLHRSTPEVDGIL